MLNLLTHRILGILSYAFLLLGVVSWAIFDVGAGLTIIFFLSSAVLYADEDAANGINMLKQRRIDWRRKLIPPLIMMHAGLFFVILSSLYDLGPFSLVSIFVVVFGFVITSRPYLPDQNTRRSSSVSRYVPIVGVWMATTYVIMVFVFRSSISFLAKFAILAVLAGFLVVLVAALLRRERVALERKPAATTSSPLLSHLLFCESNHTLNVGADATSQGALQAAGISLIDSGVIPTLRLINKMPAPTLVSLDKPLFYHFARSIAHAYLWMSWPFFGLFIYEWFVGRAELPFLGGILAVALAVLFVSLRPYRFYATQRVQEVFFYENSCRLRGKNLEREVSYSEIREISLIDPPFLASGPGIRISFKGGDETLLIPSNPKNRSLRIDLYSWLKAKVGTPQLSESS